MGLELADFSRVVSRLHAAPERPEAWQTALVDLTSCLEATACTVAVATGAAGTDGAAVDAGRAILATTIAPEAATAYQSYYHELDFIMSDCERGPIGLIRTGFDLVNAHRRTEFHVDWQRRFDMTDGLFVRLAIPGPTSFVVSAPPRAQPFANAARIRFLDALVPHLHHALRARRELMSCGQRPLDLNAATEVIGHGIVIVGIDGRILQMNPPAHRITSGADGLRVRDQKLQIGAVTVDDELHAGINAAVGGRVRVGGYVVCPRPSGAHPHVLRIVPLDTDQDPRAGRAAIIIIDPNLRPKPPKQLLRKMFGLTANEAEIALRLLDGAGIPAIADDLALSAATIKTHAHNVFAKTATHRQAELVRLLSALGP